MYVHGINHHKSEQVEYESQNQKHDSNDFGQLGQLSFLASILVLGHETFAGTSNGAGQAALTGLQHDEGNQTQSTENLNDGENNVYNLHNSSNASKDGRYSGERRAEIHTP